MLAGRIKPKIAQFFFVKTARMWTRRGPWWPWQGGQLGVDNDHPGGGLGVDHPSLTNLLLRIITFGMDLIFVARSLANLFSRNCQNSSITKDQKLNVSNLTKDKYQVALGLLLLVFEVVSSGCFALHKVSMLMSMSLSTSMSMLMSMLMSVSRSMSISTSLSYPPYLSCPWCP